MALDIDNLNFFEEDVEDVMKEQLEDNSIPASAEEQPEEQPEEPEEIGLFSAIVKTLNNKGITELPEDIDYDEDSFIDALYEQAKNTVLSDLGIEDERTQKVLKYISSGGDLKQLSKFYENGAGNVDDLDDADNQKQIVMEHYQSLGMSPRRIATIIQTLEDDGELEFEAKEIASKKQSEFEQQEKEFFRQQEQREREKQEREKEYKRTLETTLNTSKEFYGVEVTDTQRKQFKEWLNKPVKYQHTDGKIYNLTQAQIKQMELQNNPKKYAEFTLAVQYMLMNNFTNPAKEKEVERKTTQKIWNKVSLPSGGKLKTTKRESIDDVSFN